LILNNCLTAIDVKKVKTAFNTIKNKVSEKLLLDLTEGFRF